MEIEAEGDEASKRVLVPDVEEIELEREENLGLILTLLLLLIGIGGALLSYWNA